MTKHLTLVKQREAFDFAVYDALQSLAVPSSVSAIAVRLGAPGKEIDVRRVITKLFKMKAVSRSKIRGTWHYFI